MNSRWSGLEDRVAEGAFRAAAAVSALLSWELPEPGRCRQVDAADLIASIRAPDDWIAAVASELKGGENGSAAILFSRPAVDALLDSLLGWHPGVVFAERERSALCETGNIAISAAAGVLGAHAGRPVVPSLPKLDCGRAACVLSRLLPLGTRAGADVYLVDSSWGGGPASPGVRFVWVGAG